MKDFAGFNWKRRIGLGVVSLVVLSAACAQDAAQNKTALSGLKPPVDPTAGIVAQELDLPVHEGMRVRSRWFMETALPVRRLGVWHFDEWTIRAGATRLRVPTYGGWRAVLPESDFYKQQAETGEPGEHLALAMIDRDFLRATRSKYVNNCAMVWVPSEEAFKILGPEDFSVIKEKVARRIAASRKGQTERDDFLRFEDYIAFKDGNDDELEAFVDGFLLKAVDTEDLVGYFSTGEFVHQTRQQEIRRPMIHVLFYGLVHGKLIRFDLKRLYLSDEDPVRLVRLGQEFFADMQRLNEPNKRPIR